MTKDHSPQTHLSKDELLEILHEIDSEKHHDTKQTNDLHKGIDSEHSHPNPGNPFF